MAESSIKMADGMALVIGLGATGLACAETLPSIFRKVRITDTRDDLSELASDIERAEASGAAFITLADAARLRPDVVVVSPGIAPDDPGVVRISEAGGEWVSEIELASRLSKGRVLAVTGTNGKTTVVTLAGEILGKCFGDVRVSGNIGSPFVKEATTDSAETLHVVEVSSYQLERCSTFSPDVAIALNVQPDHLERHGDLRSYAAAKARIFQAMGAGQTAVLNADDETTARMAKTTRAARAEYSVEKNIEKGACVVDGRIIVRWNGEETDVCGVEEIALPGKHNVSNVLAVSMGATLMGATVEVVGRVVRSFRGLPHRLESLGVVRGVEVVNDSKGTNVEAALAALASFDGRAVTLILNGDDKGLAYDPLYDAIIRAGAKVITLGPGLARVADEIGKEMERSGRIESRRAATMKEAVEAGLDMTPEGGVLLLSPSSSSFDLYRNYEERGNVFKDEIAQKNK